jgi:tryptophan 2,3-dioxygenase
MINLERKIQKLINLNAAQASKISLLENSYYNELENSITRLEQFNNRLDHINSTSNFYETAYRELEFLLSNHQECINVHAPEDGYIRMYPQGLANINNWIDLEIYYYSD